MSSISTLKSGGDGTISSIMNALDLIASNDDNKIGTTTSSRLLIQPDVTSKSATSILMEERQLIKQRHADSLLSITSKQVLRPNPLLEQIASSSTEPPTYWKNTLSSQQHHGSKTKGSLNNHVITNAVKNRRQKGENYKDRVTEKLVSRGNRKARLDHAKRMY